jgi:hypothetical protein
MNSRYLSRVDFYCTSSAKRAMKDRARLLGFGLSEFIRILVRQEIAAPRCQRKRQMFGPPDIANRRPRVTPAKQHPEQAEAQSSKDAPQR